MKTVTQDKALVSTFLLKELRSIYHPTPPSPSQDEHLQEQLRKLREKLISQSNNRGS